MKSLAQDIKPFLLRYLSQRTMTDADSSLVKSFFNELPQFAKIQLISSAELDKPKFAESFMQSYGTLHDLLRKRSAEGYIPKDLESIM